MGVTAKPMFFPVYSAASKEKIISDTERWSNGRLSKWETRKDPTVWEQDRNPENFGWIKKSELVQKRRFLMPTHLNFEYMIELPKILSA